MDQTDGQLLSRAIAAYYQSCARSGDDAAEIVGGSSAVKEVAGKRYVVLRNADTLICVYRIRNDGILKGMRRWPKELDS